MKGINNLDDFIKKYFSSYKYCMRHTPKCKGSICDAHTISKKYLKYLSKDGHIYYPNHSFFNESGFYKLSLQGIRKCSTFLGFCEYHDKNLFSSFENTNYIGAYKQIFDFSFRILCREYFQKKSLLKYINKIINGEVSEQATLSQDLEDLFLQNKVITARQVRDHRNLYEGFKTENFSNLKYVQIKLSQIPIATTGVLFPFANWRNEIIQDASQAQKGIIYYIIPVENHSYLVFSYPINGKDCSIQFNYINSIIELLNTDKAHFIDYLLTLFIDNNDIVAIQPEWYKQINTDFPYEIENLMNRRCGQYFIQEDKLIEFLNFDKYIKFDVLEVLKKI